jgi:hypothetical protein
MGARYPFIYFAILIGSYGEFLYRYVCSELLDICSVIGLLKSTSVPRAGLVLTQRRM